MDARTLAVIATYRPGSELPRTVERLINDGVWVCVVDDASPDEGSQTILATCQGMGATVTKKPQNRGIGHSLNQGLEEATRRGADFLLTLDQDTTLPKQYATRCLLALRELDAAGVHVGLLTAGRLNGTLRQPRFRTGHEDYYETTDPMQSGSLIPVAVAVELGGFREDFIMDCVDVDFCLKVRSSGRSVVWVDGLEIQHELGNMQPARLFGRLVRRKGRVIHVSNHSDDRRYYMNRNRAILLREYKKVDPVWFRKARRAYRLETIRALVFEPKRARRIITMLTAWVHAVAGRTGKRH